MPKEDNTFKQMSELIPIVELDTMEIRGIVERSYAHRHNLCHLSCLLIPVKGGEYKVAVQIRPRGKSYAGKRDFFGGHLSVTPEKAVSLLAGKLHLAQLMKQCALHEANEELNPYDAQSGKTILISEYNLYILDNLGAFPYESPGNIERSTAYIVIIPPGTCIRPRDQVEGKLVDVQVEFMSLDEVIELYKCEPNGFADGAARILNRVIYDPKLYKQLRALIYGESPKE